MLTFCLHIQLLYAYRQNNRILHIIFYKTLHKVTQIKIWHIYIPAIPIKVGDTFFSMA